MSQPYKLHGHPPRFCCPHNTNHHVQSREFLTHNITCPYTNMILLMYIQRFSCALFSSLQFTSLHFTPFSWIPTSRCKGFTQSFPSHMVLSYSSYSFPFTSCFLPNFLYTFFPSLSVLLTKQETAFCDCTKQLAKPLTFKCFGMQS
jgi:hypothetical protein